MSSIEWGWGWGWWWEKEVKHVLWNALYKLSSNGYIVSVISLENTIFHYVSLFESTSTSFSVELMRISELITDTIYPFADSMYSAFHGMSFHSFSFHGQKFFDMCSLCWKGFVEIESGRLDHPLIGQISTSYLFAEIKFKEWMPIVSMFSKSYRIGYFPINEYWNVQRGTEK